MYREVTPPSHLAGVVECFWADEHLRPEAAHRVLPDGCVDLLFDAAAKTDEALRLVGTMTTAQLVAIPPGGSFAAVRFHPGAAASLFRVPGSVTTDRDIPFAEIAGAETVRRLTDRLHAARTVNDRIAVLQTALPKAADAAMPAALAAWMAASEGPPNLDEAARRAGVSTRHLRRLFLDQVGVGPKRLWRILRFRRAASEALAVRSWAEVAAACGYFDQAHLVRDFREFAGLTPEAWRMSVSSNTP